jgi:hypothetical protein
MSSVFTNGKLEGISVGPNDVVNVSTHYQTDSNGRDVPMSSTSVQFATAPTSGSKPRISEAKNEDARGRMAHVLSEAMQNERCLVVNRNNLSDSVGPLGGTSVSIKVYMKVDEEMVPMIVSIYADAKTEQVCQDAMEEADANFNKHQEILMALGNQEADRNRRDQSFKSTQL